MSNKVTFNHEKTKILAVEMASRINTWRSQQDRPVEGGMAPVRIYPVPTGGVPVAYLLDQYIEGGCVIVDQPWLAHIIVDDLVDSGMTRRFYRQNYPELPFFVLLDKGLPEYNKKWVVFPWEYSDPSVYKDDTIVGTIRNRLIREGIPFFANDNIAPFLGDDDLPLLQTELTKRAAYFLDGLIINRADDHNTKETAERLAKMYLTEVFAGRYSKPPVVTVFPNVKKLDELYVVGAITVRSACSHHLVPVLGKCWIGVIPSESLMGLSKFHRIVDHFARRPQIQEELVVQIADEIERLCQPLGLAVIMQASHFCTVWRGVEDDEDSKMTSSVMRGVFKDNPAAKAEFLSLVKL